MLLNITEAAGLIGVHPDTLRKWEKQSILVPLRTPGNHRRYQKDKIDKFILSLQKQGDKNDSRVSDL